MVLAYVAAIGTAPPYLQVMSKPYTPTRALRFATSGLMALPLSPVHALLCPGIPMVEPAASEARTAEFLPIFRKYLKTFQSPTSECAFQISADQSVDTFCLYSLLVSELLA